MAHTKSGGSTVLGRDSQSQRLGIKLFGGEKVSRGEVIVRQRGTKYHPGKFVKRGVDDTLYAMANGVIAYQKKKRKRFDGSLRQATFVSVVQPVKK